MNKKRILISVNALKDIGGIGTAAANLLNDIHDLYDITLCLPSNYIGKKYDIPQNVRIIKGSNYLRDVIIDRDVLSFQPFLTKCIRNVRRICNHYILKTRGVEHALSKIKINDDYDVAIAFADFRYSYSECKCFDYYVVLNNVKAKKKIAWLHNDPNRLGWTHDLALKRLQGFDYIVNVSYCCKQIFDEIIPEFKAKSKVVYNMYDINKIKSSSECEIPKYKNNGKTHIVTVARIQTAQKRVDRIIEICERLNKEGYDNFDWTLVGSSPEMENLKKKVSALGLQEMIIFAGLQSNPYPYMRQADVFVLTSDYEGYGMTLKEAQILCTPTCVTGFGAAQESVEHKKQGEICDNSVEGLYTMIRRIIDNPHVLKLYRQFLQEHPIDNKIALSQFRKIVES